MLLLLLATLVPSFVNRNVAKISSLCILQSPTSKAARTFAWLISIKLHCLCTTFAFQMPSLDLHCPSNAQCILFKSFPAACYSYKLLQVIQIVQNIFPLHLFNLNETAYLLKRDIPIYWSTKTLDGGDTVRSP